MGMQVIGVGDAAQMLRNMAARARNLTPVWPAVGGVVAGHMQQQFATAGAHGGRPWAPLKPEYLAWKLRHGYPAATLILTSEMHRTLTGRPMQIEEYHTRYADFGTKDQKAIWHHRGAGNLPQRQVLFKFPDLTRDINRRLADYIIDGRTR